MNDLDAVRPVSRFRIADPEETDVLVVTGGLTEYYLRKIAQGEPPKTLLERSVEVLSYVEGEERVIAPVTALVPGETYSIASPEHGLLGTLRVTDAAVPLLERRFPPPKTAAFPGAVLCGAKVEMLPEESWLEPGHLPLAVSLGVFGDESLRDCVSVGVSATDEVPDGSYSLPVVLGEASLDPAPLVVASGAPASAVTCLPEEHAIAKGCARVLDDRAIVRVPSGPTLWTIDDGGGSVLLTPKPDGRFVFPGLSANTTYAWNVGFLDTSGTMLRDEISFATTAPRPHVVINEVLANPLGAEPRQEWIELVNDGVEAVELEGFVLADSAGPSVLPAHSLAPGAFVILAREDFVRDDGSDVPVPSAVGVLSLSTLGKNGLSNSGEVLELRTPGDELCSRFPALPKPKAGISVARREPSALDDDADSFALHAAPGASPGASNQVLEP